MNVSMALDRLREEIRGFGAVSYLLTVNGEGRPHAVSVTASWLEDELVMTVGSKTAAYARARPLVSLLWPAPVPGAYSLCVDGTATVSGDGEVASPAPPLPGRSSRNWTAPAWPPATTGWARQPLARMVRNLPYSSSAGGLPVASRRRVSSTSRAICALSASGVGYLTSSRRRATKATRTRSL